MAIDGMHDGYGVPTRRLSSGWGGAELRPMTPGFGAIPLGARISASSSSQESVAFGASEWYSRYTGGYSGPTHDSYDDMI